MKNVKTRTVGTQKNIENETHAKHQSDANKQKFEKASSLP